MQILGNEIQPRFISTLSGCPAAGRGGGGGFSRQWEGETGIYVRSCDCNSLFCCPPCDHLVTTLWPAANEAELYNHWLTAPPLFSLFSDWSGCGDSPSQTWCTAVLKVEFLARKVSTGYRTNTGQKLAFSCNIWGYHLTRGYQFLSYVYLCRQIATDRLKESNIIS